MDLDSAGQFLALRGTRFPRWQGVLPIARKTLPKALAPWMLNTGSLTQLLIQVCPEPFHVELQAQYYGIPRFNERRSLGLKKRSYCMIRQVLLYCGNMPVVFARTIVPLSTLTGKQRRLACMGNHSLGAALFSDRTMRRDKMEIACIRPGQYFFLQACKTLAEKPDKIWGRRSVFYLRNKKLLVSEFFLPTISKCKGYGEKKQKD